MLTYIQYFIYSCSNILYIGKSVQQVTPWNLTDTTNIISEIWGQASFFQERSITLTLQADLEDTLAATTDLDLGRHINTIVNTHT